MKIVKIVPSIIGSAIVSAIYMGVVWISFWFFFTCSVNRGPQRYTFFDTLLEGSLGINRFLVVDSFQIPAAIVITSFTIAVGVLSYWLNNRTSALGRYLATALFAEWVGIIMLMAFTAFSTNLGDTKLVQRSFDPIPIGSNAPSDDFPEHASPQMKCWLLSNSLYPLYFLQLCLKQSFLFCSGFPASGMFALFVHDRSKKKM